jgi:hypothetical protein
LFSRFALQTRRGGLVKIYDSALMPGVSILNKNNTLIKIIAKQFQLNQWSTVKYVNSADFVEIIDQLQVSHHSVVTVNLDYNLIIFIHGQKNNV